MKVKVTVVEPHTVEIEFDVEKVMDDDYIDEKRQEAKQFAAELYGMRAKDLIIGQKVSLKLCNYRQRINICRLSLPKVIVE